MNHNMADTDNKNCGCCPPMASAYLIPQKIEAHAPLPMYKGDPFTYEDFTPEQIAGLQKPATDAAVEAQALMAGFSKVEVIRESNEQSRVGAENERVSREELRQKTEAARQTDEIAREAAEVKRAEAEAARGTAEQERAAEFASWETELDGKAEKSELSNIVGMPTEGEIEDIDPTLVAEALRKVPQTLTPQEQAQVKANLNISKMELFCDLFSAAAGNAGYARMVNGVFDGMLNGLPVTYEEAVEIYEWGTITSTGSAAFFNKFPCKTNLPPKGYGGGTDLSGIKPLYELNRLFGFVNITNPNILEVLNLELPQGMTIADTVNPIITITGSASGHSRLRKILGKLWITMIKSCPKFIIAPNLEEVRLCGLFHSCDLSGVPKLSLNSWRCLVENKYPTHPSSPTITVHPDVYAKLTDETNTEWHQVLIDAAAKNITFATV